MDAEYEQGRERSDFLAIAATNPGGPVGWFVRQIYTPFKTPILLMATALVAPSVQPFVASGQAVGMISGQNLAAQYELLIKKPGSSSLGHSHKYWVTFYSRLAFCADGILEILPAWMIGGASGLCRLSR